MTTRIYNDERRWASTDASLHYNGPIEAQEPWYDEFIQALKNRDYNAAERIRAEHVISDECRAKACDDCAIPDLCACAHHAAVQFPLKHPKLRSLREAESET